MDNRLINLKAGKAKDWPFSDPNYICIVREESRDVIKNDQIITRIVNRRNIILNSKMPAFAINYMSERGSTARADVYVPTKSPLAARRKNGVRKWFRPRVIRRFTKLAVTLIKDAKGSLVNAGIMNPVSKKILKGFTKMQIIFPPAARLSNVR